MEMWPYVGEVLWGPEACSPVITRAICSGGALYVSCMHTSVVVGPTTVGALVGGAGPQPGWLRGCALCGGCRPTGGQGSLPAWLAAQPQFQGGAQDCSWPAGGQCGVLSYLCGPGRAWG